MIPTFNRLAFLREAVQSALGQDYPNLEVIVSDNASEDGTGEAMKHYESDDRFSYHRNGSNIGLGANWQKLLYEYATGKYGKLLNDDDFLTDRSHVTKCVELLESKNLDIVFSGSKIIWNEGLPDPKSPTEIIFDLPLVVKRQWWLENFGKVLKKHTLFPNLVGSAVFSLEKAKLFRAFYPPCYGLDYELALKFILAADSGYFKESHWAERYHPSDANTSELDRSFEGLYLFNRVYDFGLSLGLERNKLLSFRRRGIQAFFNNFIAQKFFQLQGASIRTLLNMMKRMASVDSRIFGNILFSRIFFSRFLRCRNKTLYYSLRSIFRKFSHNRAA